MARRMKNKEGKPIGMSFEDFIGILKTKLPSPANLNIVYAVFQYLGMACTWTTDLPMLTPNGIPLRDPPGVKAFPRVVLMDM